MTQLNSEDAIQFKVNNDQSFGCKFKLPKELVSIFQKLDDKRLVKTEVKTYGKCGGMRFDLTFVNKKNNKKLGPFNFPCCNLLSYAKTSDKLREKITYLEYKVYNLYKRLDELECSECRNDEMNGSSSYEYDRNLNNGSSAYGGNGDIGTCDCSFDKSCNGLKKKKPNSPTR